MTDDHRGYPMLSFCFLYSLRAFDYVLLARASCLHHLVHTHVCVCVCVAATFWQKSRMQVVD